MTPRAMQWTAHSIAFRSTRINLIRRRVPAFLTFTIYLLSAFRSTVRMQDCVWGNVRGGTMIKPALQVESATTSWRAGPVQLIDRLVEKLRSDRKVEIVTAAHPFKDPADAFSPHQVKVVLDLCGNALYFSRAPIPFQPTAS